MGHTHKVDNLSIQINPALYPRESNILTTGEIHELAKLSLTAYFADCVYPERAVFLFLFTVHVHGT
jgi:hypothetical protein